MGSGWIGQTTLAGFMHAELLVVLAPAVSFTILDLGLVVFHKASARPSSHPCRSVSVPFSCGGRFSRVSGIGILMVGGGSCTVGQWTQLHQVR